MKQIRDIANGSGLDIWEDCTQCYTGTDNGLSKPTSTSVVNSIGSLDKSKEEEEDVVRLGYTGSDHADISFFSFGPIKTATELGGGLSIL